MLEKLMGIKPKTETDAKAGVTKRPAKAVAATRADPAVTALIRGAVVDNSVAAELRKAETLASLAPKSALGFETEKNSPFPDGYSVEKERVALKALLDAESVSESDPLYDRYLELDEREVKLSQMSVAYKQRGGGDELVTVAEADKIKSLGSLEDEREETLRFHTLEGLRFFMGRARDPQNKLQPIVGGKRLASTLKTLWVLTANDNPYADWALVNYEANQDLIIKRLDAEIERGHEIFKKLEQRGLQFSMLKSAQPKEIQLQFRSPYGYKVAQLIVTYDYFIRVQKSLERKDQITNEQMRTTVQQVTRLIRGKFNETSRFERWLMKPELRQLSRRDFVPGAPAEATQRVKAATEIFGPVPSEIYSCAILPHHTRRTYSMDAGDRRMMKFVADELARSEADTHAALLEEANAPIGSGLL